MAVVVACDVFTVAGDVEEEVVDDAAEDVDRVGADAAAGEFVGAKRDAGEAVFDVGVVAEPEPLSLSDAPPGECAADAIGTVLTDCLASSRW